MARAGPVPYDVRMGEIPSPDGLGVKPSRSRPQQSGATKPYRTQTMNTTTARLLAAIIIGQAIQNIDASYLAALTLWTDSLAI